QKCWICFSSPGENEPSLGPWRSPCPCALVAHENCLLDWIADMEADRKRRDRGIKCPQCRAEIKLQGERDVLVEGMKVGDRLAARLVLPLVGLGFAAAVWKVSTAYGVQAVYAVFGYNEGREVVGHMLLDAVRPNLLGEWAFGGDVYGGGGFAEGVMPILLDHLSNWRTHLAIPLIAPALILSRTHLIDSVLPVLPIIFFVGKSPTRWPPSPALAFAMLPYLRSAYNIYWSRIWAEREKRWVADALPRGRDANANEVEIEVDAVLDEILGADDEGEDDIFQVQVRGAEFPIIDIWGEGNGEANVDEEEDEGMPQPDVQQNRAEPRGAPVEVPEQERWDPLAPVQVPQDRRMTFSTTAIAEHVLGALLLPTVAGLSGEVLRLALPAAWATKPAGSAARGLLQHKWGRSLVGGCLFIMVKDAVWLYVKWKMASMHKRRRVMDY
ncbi:hypothetical protein K470DRAFT_201388, partial [Piedraia hortae CBS 480.64]